MKALAILFLIVLHTASTATPVPDGGSPVLKVSAMESFELDRPGQDTARAELLDITSGPVTRAWRMETMRQPAETWKFQLRGRSSGPVKRGDTLWARFFLRSSASRNETGEGHATFVFETADDRHVKSIDLTVSAGNEWREFCFPFACRGDLAAGEAQISIRAGFRPQVIEVGGIEVLNFGPAVRPADLPRTRVDYPGRELDAAWRREAEARIERIRKNDFTLRVVDARGNPAPGVKLEVRLRRHAFGFGSAVDGSILLGNGADSEWKPSSGSGSAASPCAATFCYGRAGSIFRNPCAVSVGIPRSCAASLLNACAAWSRSPGGASMTGTSSTNPTLITT